MASPVLDLTPLDFNSWDQTKDLVYEVKDRRRPTPVWERIADAANQTRNNPEMLNFVYENWYRRTMAAKKF
jgi:hypothetical protein